MARPKHRARANPREESTLSLIQRLNREASRARAARLARRQGWCTCGHRFADPDHDRQHDAWERGVDPRQMAFKW